MSCKSCDYQKIETKIDQYLDRKEEATSLGVVQIGPILHPRTNYMIEVIIENTLNGTVEIKAYDPQTGKEIRQSFSNHPKVSLIMLQQQVYI